MPLLTDQEMQNELSIDPDLGKFVIRYGSMLAAGLAGWFLLAGLLGLQQITELRYLNLFIMIGVLWAAMKDWYGHSDSHKTNYFHGFLLGFGTSIVAALLFSIFMYLFFTLFAPGLAQQILAEIPLRYNLNVWMISGIVLMEGVFSGFCVSFIMMQYFKNVGVNA
ncbi:DUF4199 domain-containing protein [Pontibacter sp. G13]|uniref:DUF4199 domain-containing protein n=1 Tax=Pontibacter sp. G13 TaxID=3074898 RepID=UPI00288BB95D|nr:DUF4199 domain-containing protein [Pontibacter sp. G13]WNJ17643.1 DUF4199 domain-containing protein [Pontibacter sp. G13]